GGVALLRHSVVVDEHRACTTAGDDESRLRELAVGGHCGVAVHAEACGELAYRRERASRTQRSTFSPLAHARGDVCRRRSCDLVVHVTSRHMSLRGRCRVLCFWHRSNKTLNMSKGSPHG